MKHLKKRLKPKCSHENCTRRSKQTHVCTTCEKLKKEEVFTRHSCWRHTEVVLAEMKKHALVKHPSNIVGATVAALKGEDVF